MSKALVLKYWNAWQSLDWDGFRDCLSDQVQFENQQVEADEFVSFCKEGNPWEDVVLLNAVFSEKQAALLYEGTDTVSEKRIRVGEFIKVENDKIIESKASVSEAINYKD